MISVQHKIIAIIEQQSLSKAANLLHISQPALSIALQKHEQELGIALVDRTITPLRATPAGLMVYEAYRKQLALETTLVSQLQSMKGEKPPLSIGMIDGVASLLAETPVLFSQLESLVRPRVVVDNSRILVKGINERIIDIALITTDQSPSEVEGDFLANEMMVLVAHPNDVSRIADEIMSGTLRSYVAYDKPSATYRLIEKGLGELGVTLLPELSSTSTDVMARLVRAGRGSAVVPFHAVRDDILAGRLSIVAKDGQAVMVHRPIYVVAQKHYAIPEGVKNFLFELGVRLEGTFKKQ